MPGELSERTGELVNISGLGALMHGDLLAEGTQLTISYDGEPGLVIEAVVVRKTPEGVAVRFVEPPDEGSG